LLFLPLLVGLAGCAWTTEAPEPGLVFAEADIEVRDCRAGEETSVLVTLHNKANYGIRVVGFELC
jgi:hypothetical protein